MNKQNLWFLTLFSFILVLGVYYITMPSNLLDTIQKEIEETPTIEKVEELDTLSAMRVSLEEVRKEKMEGLKEQLIGEELTSQEKNNLYEQLKYLNEIQGTEENIEKQIKKELDLDCFTKIDSNNISVVCISEDHNTTLANKIMRLVQEKFKMKKDITVKFQKKL